MRLLHGHHLSHSSPSLLTKGFSENLGIFLANVHFVALDVVSLWSVRRFEVGSDCKNSRFLGMAFHCTS